MDIEHKQEKRKQLKRSFSMTSLSDDEDGPVTVEKEPEVGF
jgi:hypothetical protein